MSSVTFRSESGKWRYETTLDDFLFSEIIDGLRDVGEVEGEIVIPGVMGEILEREWDALARLMDWMSYYENDSPRYTFSGEPSYLTPNMLKYYQEEVSTDIDGPIGCRPFSRRLGFGSKSNNMPHLYWPRREIVQPPPCVYLHEIYGLSQLLTFPDRWEVCVAVSPDHLTLDQRVDYLMWSSSIVPHYYDKDNVHSLLASAFQIIHKAMNSVVFMLEATGHERAEQAYMDSEGFIDAIVRSSLIAHEGELDWSTLLWNELKEMYLASFPDNYALRSLLGVIDTFIDKPHLGIVQLPSGSFGVSSNTIHLDVPSWRLLYNRSLEGKASILSSAGMLGLHAINGIHRAFSPPIARGYNTNALHLVHLIDWLHYSISVFPATLTTHERVKYVEGVGIPRAHFPLIVEMYARILGLRTLEVMEMSITQYLNQKEHDRLSLFLDAIKEYRKDHKQDGELLELTPETLLPFRERFKKDF